ncbi:MAG: tRNA (adenosine(37)-N6)-threonylcarbamoyltransferase complex dimerization subunit type 1 TsaB [bacterium]
MRILGLSSATKVISLGLIDEEKVLVETTMANPQAEKLVFYLEEAGVDPKQLDGVAVTQGPGSYSGLRGGLAMAKTLAQTLKIPIVGISTLEAIAYNIIDIEGTMMVILDARHDEYNVAMFGASGGALRRVTEDQVCKFVGLLDKIKNISGDIWLVGATKEFKEVKGANYHFADETHSQPYGINVAKLGLPLIKAGQVADPLTLVPNYSHQPNIREYNR